MSLLAYILISMPWLAGGLIAIRAQNVLSRVRQEPHAKNEQLPTCLVFGLGGILGYLALGYILWICDILNFPTLATPLNVMILAITLLAFLTLWHRTLRQAYLPNLGASAKEDKVLITILCFLLLYAIYMHLNTPMAGWDALDHWGANAAEFIKEQTSLHSANFTNQYLIKHPKTIVLINAWASWINYRLGADGWAIPWLLCSSSICLMVAGYVYNQTESLSFSLLSAVLIATLPLAEAHLLIAGYADLWLSSIVLAGLLLIALGAQYENYHYLISGALIGALTTTIKSMGFAYGLCVWGTLAGYFLLRHPKLIVVASLGALSVIFILWIQGFEISLGNIKFQWDPESQVLTHTRAGVIQEMFINPIRQVGVNELYSLVLKQSFSTAPLGLLCSLVALRKAVIYFEPNHQSHIYKESSLTIKGRGILVLILGGLLILVMLTFSQLLLPYAYSHAFPHNDTGNSRFSLSFALVAIPALFSALYISVQDNTQPP